MLVVYEKLSEYKLLIGTFPDWKLTVMENMSWHTPPLDSVVPPVPSMVNVSKSSLRKQTSEKHTFILLLSHPCSLVRMYRVTIQVVSNLRLT